MRPLVNTSSFSQKSANHSMVGSHVGGDALDCPSVSPSLLKGKKRERENESLEMVKRVAKSTGILKPDIDKIIEMGELADFEAVDKVVKFMRAEKIEKKMDLVCRSKIASAIASTSKSELLSQFVELRGISILDEWLLEVHKGKNGEGISPMEGDKCLEEFLLTLLNALDKLPVNLTELKMSNIGKSVNMLRSHKNMDIRKKARRLVDLWKKRVEAELVHSSSAAGNSENTTVSTKSPAPSGSQCGNKSPGENSSINHSYVEGSLVKKGLKNRKLDSPVPKYPSGSITPSKTAMIQKDIPHRIPVGSGGSDPPFSAYGDDRSCNSSLSHATQSCSSDQINNESSPEKENSRSSSAGSLTNKLVSSNGFREKKLLSDMLSPFPGIHKESRSKRITLRRYKPTKRVSHSEISNEKENTMPISDVYSQKLIIKFPNRICGPFKSITGSPSDKPSLIICKPDRSDCISKGGSEVQRQHVDSEENEINESWQINDSTDALHVSERGKGSATTAVKENLKSMGGGMNVSEVSRDVSSPSLVREKLVPIHEGSTKSLRVVIEGRAREPEISKTATPGYDGGMSLLADVATGDMFECTMSGHANPPVTTLEVGNSSPDCVRLSANVDNIVQEPLVYTERVDEDFEKQVEAGAILATLKNRASISVPFGENICRNLDCSMMQVEHKASLANCVTENLGNNVVTSSFEAVADANHEIVGRQNKNKIAEEETEDNDSEFVMQIESQDASQDHDQVKRLDDSLLDSRNEAKESASTNTDVASATSGLDSQPKFGFDLNETCDDGENFLGCPSETLPVSLAASGSISASVTVAAATKGPLNPPGESRKGITNQSSSVGGSVAEVPTTKETQRVLDIDLNEAYVGSLEDAQSGSFLHPYNIMSQKSAELSGFDLNLSNQDIDMSQISPGKDYYPGFPSFLSKISGNSPAVPLIYQRRFDLNSCLDEVTNDISPFSNRNSLQSQIPLPGLMMNSQGATNVSPWFPGSAVSAQVSPFCERSILQSHPQFLFTGLEMQKMVTSSTPSFFPGTTAAASTIPLFGSGINHSVSTTAAGEIQMLNTNGLSTFTPRGPMLASTPAPPFYSPFQHANLPYGTGFPMPSMSLSGGAVLVDSSSGRRQFVPGLSHPSGPTSAAYSSYYPRPYLVSLSDGRNSGSRHPWDLNDGPLGLETEKGVSTFPLQMNQLSFVNTNSLPAYQAGMYRAAGAVMRKQAP